MSTIKRTSRESETKATKEAKKKYKIDPEKPIPTKL